MAKYFQESEIAGLKEELVVKLDQLRDAAGVPIIISSGFRTPEENRLIGGVENSAHTLGLAADIKCDDSSMRYRLVKAAFEVGFKRIEVADRHLHLDLDEQKSQNVMWIDISK